MPNKDDERFMPKPDKSAGFSGIDQAFDRPVPGQYSIPNPGGSLDLGAVVETAKQMINGFPTTTASDLQDWWMEKARLEIEPLLHKMSEYGGNGRAQDLVDIGRRMNEAGVAIPGGEFHSDTNDAQHIELAIYFYVIGKIGRWTAAINEGRPVSDDTLHDLVIYTKMLQRTREVGGWPV